MKNMHTSIIVLVCILAMTAITLFAQPYMFDQNGNGTRYIAYYPHTLPFDVAPDPSGGISTSPVLIYSLGEPVISGDVALMEPNGTTIADLLRFFTPAGGGVSDLILYSQPDNTLAGVGIPYTSNPVEINEVNPATLWYPSSGQPGASTLPGHPVYETFEYDVITEAPEPSSVALVVVAAGITLVVRSLHRKDSAV